MKHTIALLVGGLLLIGNIGCENSPPPPVTPPLVQPPPALVVEPAAPPPTIVSPVAPETERVKAEAGVGIKGRSLDPHEGAVVTPVKTYFSAKERIAFEIQVPQALNLFKATEGRGPNSHEEFWEKVIQANSLEGQLPKLPPGHKYVYDPEMQELMVERPAAAPGPK